MSNVRPQQTLRYPLRWLDTTFSSQEKSIALLQPELENGNLTRIDFDKATNFFPSAHRHLPLFFTSVCAVGTIIFGSRFAKPRWKAIRLTAVGSMASVGGFAIGFQQTLDAHFRFIRSLENPAGFNRALQNINIRLGGSTPWNYGVPTKEDAFLISMDEAKSSPRTEYKSQEPQDNEINMWDSSLVPAASSGSTSKVASSHSQAVPSPSGRWDQIRAANNKKGPVSSWDVIRQNHERNHINASGDSQSQDSDHDGSAFEAKEDTTRALDEVQFDTMLETERRRTSRS